MSRSVSCLAVCVVLLCGAMPVAPVHAQDTEDIGLAVCVGINKYPHLGEVPHCREDAQALAAMLRAGGYRTAQLLVDGAKDWENRATIANIQSFIQQLSLLSRPQDRLVVFF